MKDVVAVLGEWNSDGPIHIELVACDIEDAGLKKTADVGLKAIAKALASCPPLSAERVGSASVEVGSEDDSLVLSLKIGRVTVNIVIRGDAERIGENADVAVYEHVDLKEGF
ncbi:MAG TPA: hypothetical protein DDY78_02250 [Planctomycetales bacterium]|jgi:hypothetical protein|nr:hypothetical protein [Planctomycetales bacterium]